VDSKSLNASSLRSSRRTQKTSEKLLERNEGGLSAAVMLPDSPIGNAVGMAVVVCSLVDLVRTRNSSKKNNSQHRRLNDHETGVKCETDSSRHTDDALELEIGGQALEAELLPRVSGAVIDSLVDLDRHHTARAVTEGSTTGLVLDSLENKKPRRIPPFGF